MSDPAVHTLIVRRGNVIHPYLGGEAYGEGQEVRMTIDQARPYLAAGQVRWVDDSLPRELADLTETLATFDAQEAEGRERAAGAEEVADDDA